MTLCSNSNLYFDLQDGKYLIVKDPNKQILRLYDIPDNTFESEDDSEESEEGRNMFDSVGDLSWEFGFGELAS